MEQSPELLKRLRIVRRDMGSMLFHFTRRSADKHHSAYYMLTKILSDGKLKGANCDGAGNCVCFTESPIEEFNSVFSLNAIASKNEERVRYEPYGIGVSKEWLFGKGGRPVIYDSSAEYLSDAERYRWKKYDPTRSIDYTWEREWRIKTDALELDSQQTLVIVPTADEAFEVFDEHVEQEPDWDVADGEAYISGLVNVRKWLVASLDLFGFDNLAAE